VSSSGSIPGRCATWVSRAEIDEGHRPGVPDEAKRIAELEREVKELRRANEILKTASAVLRRGGARPQAEVSTAVLVDYIDRHREKFGVEPICTVLRQAGMPIAPSS
jgi:hypothetical protein